ncbi:SAM-dependent methyltransferase [Nocardioides sp. B-3]|uniref:SAM-dependent methyltransferase n=1 Tax=Nocardioides sp. B-3 TaxID=2895565 RepID=UPI002153A4B8|nr:hypothetical protein [Nocardioides sp. B-3]UUZ58148.1 hypothetical protein LP418_17970 [Nocardioides sp. B-3]
MLLQIVRELDLRPDSVAVDVGCGSGAHSFRLATHFGLAVLGVDPVRGQPRRRARGTPRRAGGDRVPGDVQPGECHAPARGRRVGRLRSGSAPGSRRSPRSMMRTPSSRASSVRAGAR